MDVESNGVLTLIHGWFRASWMVNRFLSERQHLFTSLPAINLGSSLTFVPAHLLSFSNSWLMNSLASWLV